MKKEYSNKWKGSAKPRKQKKYLKNAPLHIKQKQVSIHLSKELKKKHSKRSLQARKGDKVKIVRGEMKGKIGKITLVSLKKQKIQVEGIEVIKKDGSKAPLNITPSNTIITELELSDKKRIRSVKAEKKTDEGNKKNG